MSIKQAIKATPKLACESERAYAVRLADLHGLNPTSIRTALQRNRERVMTVTSQTFDGEGGLVSTTQKLQQKDLQEYDLPLYRVSTNVTTGQQWEIRQAGNKGAELVSLHDVVAEAMSNLDLKPYTFKKGAAFTPHTLSNFITDVHAGMDASKGFLDYEWNAKILRDRFESNLQQVVQKADTFGRFEVIKLIDLGDTLDGYEGLTTRSGHTLAQNMSSAEQFQLCLEVYVQYIKNLLEMDLCDNICMIRAENDNHGGSFGQSLGVALEAVVRAMFPDANITFKRQSKFLDFQVYGDHVSVYTHGKDKEFLKQNLPYEMTPRWSQYLMSIFKKWGLLDKKISVYKGDLHRLGLSTNPFFDYYNFRAFSPPSGWAAHNFGASDSGYSIHVIGKDKRTVNIENMQF